MSYLVLIILLALGISSAGQDFYVGSASVNFVDPERNNHVVNTTIYYPAETAGQNVPIATGEFDCATPPSQRQHLMYEATASQQKITIDIFGGGHCYFADYNFLCSLGESSCVPQPLSTREKQQAVTLDFLNLYFGFILKNNVGSWQVFQDSLQSSPRIY